MLSSELCWPHASVGLHQCEVTWGVFNAETGGDAVLKQQKKLCMCWEGLPLRKLRLNSDICVDGLHVMLSIQHILNLNLVLLAWIMTEREFIFLSRAHSQRGAVQETLSSASFRTAQYHFPQNTGGTLIKSLSRHHDGKLISRGMPSIGGCVSSVGSKWRGPGLMSSFPHGSTCEGALQTIQSQWWLIWWYWNVFKRQKDKKQRAVISSCVSADIGF